jgi:hypothetical protein
MQAALADGAERRVAGGAMAAQEWEEAGRHPGRGHDTTAQRGVAHGIIPVQTALTGLNPKP